MERLRLSLSLSLSLSFWAFPGAEPLLGQSEWRIGNPVFFPPNRNGSIDPKNLISSSSLPSGTIRWSGSIRVFDRLDFFCLVHPSL